MRVRGPSSTITLAADDDWTVAYLLSTIREQIGVQRFSLRGSYPPTPIDLSSPETRTLAPLKLNGGTLSVIPDDGALAGASASTAAQPPKTTFTPKKVEVDETVVPWDEGGGYLSRSIV